MFALLNSIGSSGNILLAKIIEYIQIKNNIFQNDIYDLFKDKFFYSEYINLYEINKNQVLFYVDLKKEFNPFITFDKQILNNISTLITILKPHQAIKLNRQRFYIHRDPRDIVVSMLQRKTPISENIDENILKKADLVIYGLAKNIDNHFKEYLKYKNYYTEISFFDLKNNLDKVILQLKVLNLKYDINDVIDFITKNEDKTLKQDGKKFGKYIDFFDDIDFINSLFSNDLYKITKVNYDYKKLRIYGFYDILQIDKLKECYIYGAGKLFEGVRDILYKYMDIKGIIDDTTSKNIDYISNNDKILVCANKYYTNQQMINKLLQKGIKKENIFCVYPIKEGKCVQ